MWQTNRKLLKLSKSGLRIINEGEPSPFMLAEPEWVPDKNSDACFTCQQKFTFTYRKHHCRRCGRCFCGGCCKDKVFLSRMSFIDPVLQCKLCSPISKLEIQFFETDLPLILKGELLIVSIGDPCNVDTVPTFCKLSSSHKSINLTPSKRSDIFNMDTIDLMQINDYIVSAASDDQEFIININLLLHHSEEQLKTITISSSPSNNNYDKQIAWLSAFHKCLKMIDRGRQNVSSMNVES